VANDTETPSGARDTARAYDLALHTSRQGLVFARRNRGITLADDRLDWVISGEPDAALLASIVEINLRTGGVPTSPIAQCRIRFKDGFVLNVSDATWTRHQDEVRRTLYRDFVHDLHRRLGALTGVTVRFIAGYTKTEFHVMALGALFFVAICIGLPITAFFIRPDREFVLGLVVGAVFVWPLLRMMHFNSPGGYDPRKLPTGLVP
jgi:hypothetical protein